MYKIKFVFLLFIWSISILLLNHSKNLEGKKGNFFLPNSIHQAHMGNKDILSRRNGKSNDAEM